MAPDPDGDTTTTSLGSSQEAPTLSGALTKPFRRPESVRPWPQEASSFPAPGGHFDAHPSVAPVGPGGTLAMHVTSAGGDPDRDVGTLVLNAAEALAAARVDPRSPHTRASEAPAAGPSQPAPTFGPPPSFAPAYVPEVPPSFGPPPGLPGAGGMQQPAAYGAPAMDPGSIQFGPAPQSFGHPDPALLGYAAEPPSPAMGLPAMGAASVGPSGSGNPQASFAPSAFPDPFGAGSMDTSGPSYPIGAHEPSRPVRLYVALGVAVVAVASLVGYATYLVLGDSASTQATPVASRPIGEDLENALLAGGPPDLLKADSILRSKEGEGAPEILLARVRERTLSALDVSGDPAGIDTAVQNAKNAGVPPGDVAFAELVSAILRSDVGRADQIADQHRADRSRDALFNLALAVMAERRGDPAAQELLRTALAVEPRLRPASVRLARWLILHGDAIEARKVVDTLPEGDPSRKALDALAATKSWLMERKAGTKPPGEPAVITAEIPRSLHAIFSAVKLVSDAEDAAEKRATTGKSNPEAQAQLKRAIDEAESPALALLFGDIALARGDEAMAFAAASRTLTLTPGSREALTMLGRASVSLGKLDQLDAMLEKLPSESTIQLRAFSAYEQGKTDALTKLAQGLTDQTDPGGAVRVRLTRVRGTAPIPPDAIERLLAADPVGGDLCAVDALLDAGEMEKARVIVDGWGDGALNPLRAPRVARLLRYEGKSREAVSALGAATQSKAVLVERILLGADSTADREQTLALIDERLGTDRTFWNAYVLAKNGDGDKAKALLEAASPPSFDTPLSSRVAAALAHGEVQDAGRGEPIARVLLESFPKNPDVRRAAKALGVEERR